MKLIGMQGRDFQVQLSCEELLIINNALNEACNGIEIPEFHIRIGASIEDVEKLLKTVGDTFKKGQEKKA